MTKPELDTVFAALRGILAPYAAGMDATRDDATELYLNTRHRQKNGQPLFFGAVQMKKTAKKAQVSVHLMPVYLQPGLLDGLTPALKARMHGKSCFNFTTAEPALLQELAALVQAGHASYQAQGWVPGLPGAVPAGTPQAAPDASRSSSTPIDSNKKG